MRKYLALACIVSLGAGCATASKDITAAYVSPLQYEKHDCEQISMEMVRVQSRVAELGGRLDEAAANDQGIAAAGIILFWPALFFLGGTQAQEAEYARLKGEYDALHQQAIAKKCSPSSTIHSGAALEPSASKEAAPTTAPARLSSPPATEAEPTRYRLVPAS